MLSVSVSGDAGLCICSSDSELSANFAAELPRGRSAVVDVSGMLVIRGDSRTPSKSSSSFSNSSLHWFGVGEKYSLVTCSYSRCQLECVGCSGVEAIYFQIV